MNHRLEFKRIPFVTPMDTELLLRRYGIPVTGRDMGNHHPHGDGGKGDRVNRNDYGFFALCVPTTRAGWAEYLLYRWGYPPVSELVNPTNANVVAGPIPPEWGAPAEAKTPMDWVLKIMCMVTGGTAWDLKSTVKRKPARLGRLYR